MANFLIKPLLLPPLDPEFVPAVLVNRKFRQLIRNGSTKFIIGLERSEGETSRFELDILPEDHPCFEWNYHYVERIIKFLLWQRGGHKLYLSGPEKLVSDLSSLYTPTGDRAFDYHFFGHQVYEQEFKVIACTERDVPLSNETGQKLGGHLNGYRIGFDLGASDRKVVALIDGVTVFSEEIIWEPRKNVDPDYHFREIMSSIQNAAAHLPRLDAIGGSSAGIIRNNRPMVASLFRGIPESQYHRIKNLFLRIRDEMGVPFEVINDGDVTALAGAMAIKDNGILGIALGSSEAAGYVNKDNRIMGWLNELAFAPVDYNPNAPVDEWSGDRGCGVSYFSQQCVFRLASLTGLSVSDDLPDAEKLLYIQNILESGSQDATSIWETMGIYLGYGIAHYADFYDINHVLILGRCTSGKGGDLLLEGVKKVLSSEFPDLLTRIELHLPDEKIRRIGQSFAAASLPYLPPQND